MNLKAIFSKKSKWNGATEDEKFMALKKAINSESINEIRQRLKEGININTLDSYSKSNILMYYSSNAKNLNWNPNEIVEFLKSKGVDINHLRNNRLKGSTSSLHLAVIQKNFGLLEALINNGAEIEIKDGNGNTPLWKAVIDYRGGTEMMKIIKLLLTKEASLDIKNNHGNSARDNIKRIAKGIEAGHNKKEWDLSEII